MKFKIGPTVYDAAELDMLSLVDILKFEKETADLGNPMRWSDIERIQVELEALKTDKERMAHADFIWLTAVTIWASRRLAGEKATFEEAISFPMRDLKQIEEPQDKKAAEGPTKARTGSVRAAKLPRPIAAAKTGSAATSLEASTAG